MRRRERRDFNDKEFFGFVKKYLSEPIPNPQRVVCSPDSELSKLADQPRKAHPFVPQHLHLLPPASNRYMDILAKLKAQ